MKHFYIIGIYTIFLSTLSYTAHQAYAMNQENRNLELMEQGATPNVATTSTIQRSQTAESNTSRTLSHTPSQTAIDGTPNESTHLRLIATAENSKHHFYNPILYYYSLCSAIFWDIAKDKFGLGMILFPALAMATFQWAPYAPQDQQDFYNSRGQLCLLIGMVCGTMQAYAAIVGPAREKQVIALRKLWKKEQISDAQQNTTADIENPVDDLHGN